jgi:hypothetical protein
MGKTREGYVQWQREIHARVAAETERIEQEGRTYTLAVVGVSHKNEDGTDRQAIIKRCRAGDPLELRREPENRYDPNAIAVLLEDGRQIGYLSRENAEWVAEVMDRDRRVAVSIASIQKAGPFFRRKRGVQITLTKY